MSDSKIWVVIYQDFYNMIYSEPIVTCFNNEENAMKYYSYILGRHDKVDINVCEIYTNFIIYNHENT